MARICIFARAMRAHGAGTYVWPFDILASEFTLMGHAVTVLTTAHPQLGGTVVSERGVEVHYLPGTLPEKVDAAFWRQSAAVFNRLSAEIGFDVVLGRGASAYGYLTQSAYAGTIPLICHEGTYPLWLHRIDSAPSVFGRIRRPLQALWRAAGNRPMVKCLTSADYVVCNSEGLESALHRAYWWTPLRTRAIPYGLDPATFTGGSAATAVADVPLPGDPVLLYVGRVNRAKGAFDLLEILARLRHTSASLFVAGQIDAGVREPLLKRAEELGLATRFVLAGPVPHTRLPALLAKATAFVFPSRHPEGLAKVVMEAMAAALPVVTYDQPTYRGLIENGQQAFIVAPGDVEESAQSLDALLGDPGLAREMGTKGQERIRARFSTMTARETWRGLIAELVEAQAVSECSENGSVLR